MMLVALTLTFNYIVGYLGNEMRFVVDKAEVDALIGVLKET